MLKTADNKIAGWWT